MEFEQSTSVAIDGTAIRRIREEKRLTQLYVSKVVSVTTDTVSRWENNRYPTIRRDNALKLAEALEVDLQDILKREEPEIEETGDSLPVSRKNRWPLYALLLLLVVGAAWYLQGGQYHQPEIEAERYLPPYAAPGSRVLMRVKLSSDKPLKGMILREEFPKGWTLVEADPAPSSLDNVEGIARWIFRSPTTQTSVAYKLEVAKGAQEDSQVTFSGELIANPDGQRYAVPLKSVGQMSVKPLHWADTNGNQVIEDLEILKVSELLDETGKLHLEWDLIERMWDSGGYRWSEQDHSFLPLVEKKVPPPE